jgi:nucleotide-binding universal stress UspA family protein
MFKKILIAYDGSEHSKRAAQLAGELARREEKTELWLVCVMDMIPVTLGEPYITEAMNSLTQAGEDLLRDAKKILGKDVPVNDELLFGSPAEGILDVAKNRECDLIIMGARGMSGLRGLLLGSQINKVINHSTCPVLAVK